MAAKKVTREQTDALFAAAREGKLKQVKALLKAGVGPNVKNRADQNETPLMAAGERGHVAVFLELVKAGADLHAVNDLGWSVLKKMSDVKGALPMIQAVIADGLRPSDGVADTLSYASSDGELDVVRALLAAGADPNRKGDGGQLPLLYAVMNNRPEFVAELLRAGARTDAHVPRDEFGDNKHYKKTPLEVALAEGFAEVAALLRAAGAKVAPKPKRPTKTGPVAESWKRIDQWLKQNARRWKPVRKGVTEEKIAKAEKTLGFKLPDDVRESYLVHDGVSDEGFFPFADDICHYLMPLAEVVGDWEMQKEVMEGGNFDDSEAKGDRGVRSEWWNVGWVPFASNGAGDFFCIDTVPAKGGKKGQVIYASHEAGERRLLAPSLRDLLYKLANDLEDGKYSYDEDDGLV
jgi:cell wall assembly regulator SMI1